GRALSRVSAASRPRHKTGCSSALPLSTLASSERALLIGMGGGGDVVGALAITDLLDGLDMGGRPAGEAEERPDSRWVLGGVAWERSPIDPRPGPRSLD